MKYLMAIFATSACLLGASSVASSDLVTVPDKKADTSNPPVEYINFKTPIIINVKQSTR